MLKARILLASVDPELQSKAETHSPEGLIPAASPGQCPSYATMLMKVEWGKISPELGERS